jgi:hypothetical protein
VTTGEAAPALVAETEIGWTEVDDISQIGLTDGDEGREYSFEEADAATLAELGLLPSDGAAVSEAQAAESSPTDAPAEEAPKPRRGRKPAVSSEVAEAPKSQRGRSRATARATASAKTEGSAKPKSSPRASKPKGDDDSGAAPKPRPRSRTKPAAEPAPAEGAEEGIWQRFRGARTKAP